MKQLRAKIEHLHLGDPQAQMHCDLALREIENALTVLARFGHHFHLEDGHQPETQYPRVVYSFRQGAREVRSEYDLAELGPGWYDSPRDAELAEGIDTQFAGRGGVQRYHQLTIVGDSIDWAVDWKRIAIEHFKRRMTDGLRGSSVSTAGDSTPAGTGNPESDET